MKSIESLQAATSLEGFMYLSDDAKEQTWPLIELQIESEDWLNTNGQDDADSVTKTICEPNERYLKLMESDSYSEEDDEGVSDEAQQYKMVKSC